MALSLNHSEHDEALITYPLPLAQDGNKKLWIINGCQIWALNYESALELAYMAQSAYEEFS
jgi:hypothetical protein